MSSSSIAIPKRTTTLRPADNATAAPHDHIEPSANPNTPGSSSSIAEGTPRTSDSPLDPTQRGERAHRQDKGKAKASQQAGTSVNETRFERRTSWLGSSLSKSEHTVINVGEPDRPRLITCVKSSQGFDWNTDIFLPSYATSHRDYSGELERRQDPVEDIVLTEDEAQEIFPTDW